MAHDDENEMSCCDCDGIGAAVHGGASNADDGVGGGMDDCDYVDEYTDEEEISFVDNGDECSDGMRRVDEVLGVLEQVVLGEEFGALQLEFCKKNCHHFEDSEENKLIYMDLFSSYTSMLEEIIERELKSRIDDFDMESFLALLMTELPEEELQGNEIFELLLTIMDFEHFKEFMLGCKTADSNSDLGVDFALKPTSVTIHDICGAGESASGVVQLPL